MHIGQALDLVSRYDSLRNPLASLGDYLDPELISRALKSPALSRYANGAFLWK
jgi:putative transposase